MAHRHGLDHAQHKAVFHAEGHHGVNIAIVHALHRHHVDLDPFETCLACGTQAVEHLLQAVAAGDLLHALATQRIQAHVQPHHACISQSLSVLDQLRAVGGQRQVFHVRQRGNASRQIRQIAAQQRLAASQAKTRRAQTRKRRHHPRHLVERQPVLRLLEIAEAFGNAIGTAQVAAVGHRHAQVVDAAAKTVHKLLRCSIGRRKSVVRELHESHCGPISQGRSKPLCARGTCSVRYCGNPSSKSKWVGQCQCISAPVSGCGSDSA